MRLGTFLLGGIAGAAAVIYLNRKSKSMLFSAFSSSNESVGNVMGKAKDSFSGKSVKDMTANSAASASGLDKVEKIVKEDPALKHTVNEILAENKETTTTIQ